MEIRGVKDAKNRVPVRLTFCTKFSSDDNILLVEQGHRFIKRYVEAVIKLMPSLIWSHSEPNLTGWYDARYIETNCGALEHKATHEVVVGS